MILFKSHPTAPHWGSYVYLHDECAPFFGAPETQSYKQKSYQWGNPPCDYCKQEISS